MLVTRGKKQREANRTEQGGNRNLKVCTETSQKGEELTELEIVTEL